jgi:hypothetical protein
MTDLLLPGLKATERSVTALPQILNLGTSRKSVVVLWELGRVPSRVERGIKRSISVSARNQCPDLSAHNQSLYRFIHPSSYSSGYSKKIYYLTD